MFSLLSVFFLAEFSIFFALLFHFWCFALFLLYQFGNLLNWRATSKQRNRTPEPDPLSHNVICVRKVCVRCAKFFSHSFVRSFVHWITCQTICEFFAFTHTHTRIWPHWNGAFRMIIHSDVVDCCCNGNAISNGGVVFFSTFGAVSQFLSLVFRCSPHLTSKMRTRAFDKYFPNTPKI